MVPTLLPALLSSLLFAPPQAPRSTDPYADDADATVPSLAAERAAAPKADDADLPFGGSGPFVGRMVVPSHDGVHLEVGVEGQAVPLNLVLASTRDSLIASGVSSVCEGSADANCLVTAEADTDRALAVLNTISESQWSDVMTATTSSQAMAATLKRVGITRAEDIEAVQQYLNTIPLADRQAVFSLARHLADNPAGVRLEPFATLSIDSYRVRLGAPVSVGSTSSFGNLNLDVATGWTFPFRYAALGLSVGVLTCLPTASGAERLSLMADLFQAPKYLVGMLTLAPYVVGGVDAGWVSLVVHTDLWIQAGVRGTASDTNAEVFQYGTGLTLGPHFPVALVAQLEGLEGLHNARAYKSLFAIGGLQARLWAVAFGVAVQVPLVDRASEDLGTYEGVDVGKLARYTVLARTSVEF